MRLPAISVLWHGPLLSVSLSVTIGLFLTAVQPCLPRHIQPVEKELNSNPKGVPLLFVGNHGQARPEILFSVNTPHLHASFKSREVEFNRQGENICMRFVGANSEAAVDGIDRQPGHINFIIGSDPDSWRTNLPLYGAIQYRDLYPGIDMRFAGSPLMLKSEYIVHPGADASQIRFNYTGIEHLLLDDGGVLVLVTRSGELREDAPDIYQIIDSDRVPVEGGYYIHNDGSVGFQIASHDRSRTLVIDPELQYSTYLGGGSLDYVTDLAVDSTGKVHVTGWTDSTDFPTVNPLGSAAGSVDVFVAKYTADGSALEYATYLGGNSDDRGFGIALDGDGNAIVTGYTASSNFPTQTPIQSSLAGGRDAFVLKLNSSGTGLVFSTYYGGNGQDSANSAAVDSGGNIYVAGDTYSSNFPVFNAFQNNNAGSQDAFLTKLSSSGLRLYSTLLGGQADDKANGVVLDSGGFAYVTGVTNSSNFPTQNALQSSNAGGQDAFVSKFAISGSELFYSTYMGGSGGTLGSPEEGTDIAVDNAGNAYVTGTTSSSDFPVTASFQSAHGGGNIDAFAFKLNAGGSALTYSTFLGGNSADYGAAIAIDGDGNASITGHTSSTNFPTADPYQSANAGSHDAYLSTLNVSGDTLSFGTYLGGSLTDGGTSVAIDPAGNIYVGGTTQSSNFPTNNPIQASNAGILDSFVAKFGLPIQSPPSTDSVTPSGGSGSPQTFQFTFSDANGFQQIGWTYMLFNSQLNQTNGCFLQYNHPYDTLWLRNDADTTWLGPLLLGSPGTLENSQCSVDSGLSSASGNGATLTVDLALSFKAAFVGTKNVYMYAADTTALNSGWQQKGTWLTSANQAPVAVSVAPSSGSGSSQVFQFTYSDANGYQQMGWNSMLFSTQVNQANSCYLQFNHPSNTLYLRNDAGTAWLGPVNLGSAGTLENSQCSVNSELSSFSGAGTTLTVDLALSFKAAFAGAKNVYMHAADTMGLNSGWQQKGTWNTTTNQAPVAVSVAPSSGSSSSQVFQFTYSDANGHQQMGWTFMLFNTQVNQANSCYLQFKHPSNTLYLRNDAGTAWLGPVNLGSVGTLENSQCSVNSELSSFSGVGTTLTVDLALSFKAAFVGTKNIYMYAADTMGLNSGWQQKGTWLTSANQAPVAVSVAPSSGSGSSQVFQFTYSDANGYQQMGWTFMLFNTQVNQANSCYLQFKHPSNTLYLRNDAGTAWLGPVNLGSAGTLENSQCSVNSELSSFSGAGTTLTVDLVLSFKAAFAGTKNIYMFAADTTALDSGWQLRGAWNTTTDQAPVAVSVAPSSGSGSSQVFQFTYSDANGYQQMGWTFMLFNTQVNQANSCYLQFKHPSNTLYLRNDTGTAWLGPVNLGSAGTLENSQCSVNSELSSFSGAGTTLTVDLALSFKAAFAGAKNVYMLAADTTGMNSGWQLRGAWTTAGE